ncbi:MAG: MBL fold metallo-hydrolase [Candidatus Bathyarchaeota archaeon]
MKQTGKTINKTLIVAVVLVLITSSLTPAAYAKPKPKNLKKGYIVEKRVSKNVIQYVEFVPMNIDPVLFPEIAAQFPEGSFYSVNVYVVKTSEGLVLIDCGTEDLAGDLYKMIKKDFKKEDVLAVYLTHGHADHAGGGSYFKDQGISVYAPIGDLPIIRSGAYAPGIPDDFMYIPYEPSDILEFASLLEEFTIIPSPGHTYGSVSIKYDDGKKTCLFTGDATFPPPKEDTKPLDQTFELNYFTLYNNYLLSQSGYPNFLELQIGSLYSLKQVVQEESIDILCPGHSRVKRAKQIEPYLGASILLIENFTPY